MAVPPSKPKPAHGREIFTFREGKMWVATWRRFDIAVSAPTEREACRRLIHTIAFHAIRAAEVGKLRRFGSVPRASAALVDRWRRAHNATHMN